MLYVIGVMIQAFAETVAAVLDTAAHTRCLLPTPITPAKVAPQQAPRTPYLASLRWWHWSIAGLVVVCYAAFLFFTWRETEDERIWKETQLLEESEQRATLWKRW